jgi:hypothetical protein
LAIASIIVSGCSDSEKLEQTRNFVKLTEDFKDKSSEISSDMYYSCLRRTGYYQIDNPGLQSVRDQALDICEQIYKPAWERAGASTSVLTEYMTALGNVAGFNFDSTQDLNRIKTVLSLPENQVFELNDNTIEAGFGIISFLLNTSIRRMQVEGLTQPIVCTNDYIQDYTQGLAQAFQIGYIDGVLVEEQIRARDYYSVRALTMRDEGSGNPLDFQVLEERLSEATEKIANRKIAGENYREMLETIARKHNQLAAVFRAGNETVNCSETPKDEQVYKGDVQKVDEALTQQILSEYQNEMIDLSRVFDQNWPK